MRRNRFSPITDRPTSSLTALGLLGAGLICLLAVGCNGNNSSEEPTLNGPKAVRVAEVTAFEGAETLWLPGVTRATERAELAFLHAGYLAERSVQRGQSVMAGERLAVLHNPALAPEVAAAEARVRELEEQLRQAESEAERLENLFERRLVATEERDRGIARRNALGESRQQALAQLDRAREQLAEANLRAPFAGRIAELMVEPGSFVAAGQPVIALEGDGLEVAVEVPAVVSARLAVGQISEVRASPGTRPGAAASGIVREVGRAQARQPASVVIALEQPGPDWQPGLPIQVGLRLPLERQIEVPLDALINPGAGQSYVFRIRAGVAREIPVTVHRLRDRQAAVSGDIDVGDLVVVAGQGRLLDGEPVRLLNPPGRGEPPSGDQLPEQNALP